jgi:hypothetical protein
LIKRPNLLFVPRFLDVVGEIEVSIVFPDSAGKILIAEIVVQALVGILTEEAPARSFAYRLLWRAVTLTLAAGLSESSTRRRIGPEALSRGPITAWWRFGQVSTWGNRARPRRTVVPLASFVDHERPSHEKLIIEAANCVIGLRALTEFHERKATRLTRLAIEGEIDVGKRAYYRKVLAQRRFSCAVRKITNKETNSHPTLNLQFDSMRSIGDGPSV